MYERHFGLSSPPFRLSADPEFLFTSAGHADAIDAMRGIFVDPRTLLVIAGDLGAGKTTVLRALIEEWRVQGVAVAQLVSTQLDATELLEAVALQFGATATGDAASDFREPLRRRFLGLQGHRALLAIDESQNLSPEALRCLAELAELASAAQVEFRICLVGHPELRANVARAFAAVLDTFGQPMCHLGTMGPEQTRGYIEHRLRIVGWEGVPSFDAPAFDEIHRFTDGVPRRINVLANRLLLAQMLAGGTRIDAPCVVAVARALRAETAHERPVAHHAARVTASSQAERGSLLLVASGRSDQIKVVPLLHAIEARADLPTPRLFSATGRLTWELNRKLHRFVGLVSEPVACSAEGPLSLNDLSVRFEEALVRYEPNAVVVFDGNAASECCALICREREVPVVHVGSDPQGVGELLDAGSPRAVIARIADLRFSCQPVGRSPGPDAAPSTVSLGNPLIDAVRFALQMEMRDPESRDLGAFTGTLQNERLGYGVVALKACDAAAAPARSDEQLALLREVSRDLPLVWPMRRADTERPGLARMLEGCQVTCIDELGHGGFLRLLCGATCALTDCFDVIEEAAALHVPAISLGAGHVGQAAKGGWLQDEETGTSVVRITRAVWQIAFNGGREIDTPPRWDGHAAPRIVEFLAGWLGRRAAGADALRIAVEASPG
ncbi:MAG: AAA family ATPase [Pseudomonadota bacterium]